MDLDPMLSEIVRGPLAKEGGTPQGVDQDATSDLSCRRPLECGRDVINPSAGSPDVELEIAAFAGGVDLGNQGLEHALGITEEVETVAPQQGGSERRLRQTGQPRIVEMVVRDHDLRPGRSERTRGFDPSPLDLNDPIQAMSAEVVFPKDEVGDRPDEREDENDEQPGERHPDRELAHHDPDRQPDAQAEVENDEESGNRGKVRHDRRSSTTIAGLSNLWQQSANSGQLSDTHGQSSADR